MEPGPSSSNNNMSHKQLLSIVNIHIQLYIHILYYSKEIRGHNLSGTCYMYIIHVIQLHNYIS